jgi:N6-L-threonylcarbamoyladenine synthase
VILSIESSCDDSSIAITRIKDAKLLFHKKISQEIDHSVYGGVVPELAARLHAIALPNILEETKEYFKDLKAIAVTNEPGLSVTLVEGVSMAKALSISLDIPLIPINHLKGHIYSLFIEKKEEDFPMLTLLVSGGHTKLLHVKSYDDITTLATTLDDSFGESFDKVAKMLGLGYPGGPIVEECAKKGDEKACNFTVPLSNSPKVAFSYSGLKNQVRLAIEEGTFCKEDICASFQRVATEHLIQKIKKVLKKNKYERFAIVGGASANLYLRDKIENICSEFGMSLHVASLKFCSDNAAMIGRCALKAYELKRFALLDEININPKINF